MGKKRSAQEDREPGLTCQSQVCFWSIFACIKQSEYTSNGKPDKNRLWAVIPQLEHGSRGTATQMSFLCRSLHWAAGDYNKQNTKPHACHFWSGILQLFQRAWGDRLPLLSLGCDNRRDKQSAPLWGQARRWVTEDLLVKTNQEIKQAKSTFNPLKSVFKYWVQSWSTPGFSGMLGWAWNS